MVTLLLVIIMAPVSQLFKNSNLMDMIMATLVMVASLNAISHKRRSKVILSVILATLYVISGWIQVAFEGNAQLVISHAFAAALYCYIAALLFQVIIIEDDITVDQIFAAVAIYIFIGLTWAHFYAVIGAFDPESVRGLSSITDAKPADYIYFSFVTLTTLGYGDMLPTNPITKALVIVEAITGVMFVAVLISTLVGRVNKRR